jgi:trimethylamine:corrinoid methyltransferase-like protein
VGKPAIYDVAHKKVREVLDNHFPSHISEEMDANIRSYLDIRLPREKMLHPSILPATL